MFTGRFFNGGHVLLEIADGCMFLAAAMGVRNILHAGALIGLAMNRLLCAHEQRLTGR